MSKTLIFGTIVLLLIAGVLYANRMGKINTTPVPTATASPVAEPEGESEPSGTIEGSLGFPSEVIPRDMIICAESLDRPDMICTNVHIEDEKYNNGVGYNLIVPPGSYHVYAYLTEDSERKAYYNEFVTCGLLASCVSHEPIEVVVQENETVSEINPVDWYQIPAPEAEEEYL